jgi:hypothetical protein
VGGIPKKRSGKRKEQQLVGLVICIVGLNEAGRDEGRERSAGCVLIECVETGMNVSYA